MEENFSYACGSNSRTAICLPANHHRRGVRFAVDALRPPRRIHPNANQTAKGAISLHLALINTVQKRLENHSTGI